MADDTGPDFDQQTLAPTPDVLTGMLHAVFEHWQDARGKRWARTWSDFALELLPPRVIPWCVAVNVERDPLDFVYRFWGTERARLQGQELTGKRISTFRPETMAKVLFAECAQIVETRQPFLYRKRHTTPTGLSPGFESLRLPLSNGGSQVGVVLSVARSESLTSDNYRYFGTEPPLPLTDGPAP
ncbi:MAG: hypothetical protein VW405_14960 [Rhodospirillaceae bacterium]